MTLRPGPLVAVGALVAVIAVAAGAGPLVRTSPAFPPTRAVTPARGTAPRRQPAPKATPAGVGAGGGHLPLGSVAAGILLVAVAGAVLALVRRPGAPGEDHADPDDADVAIAASSTVAVRDSDQALGEAVRSARRALDAGADPRAAVIACWVALEGNLAAEGAPRRPAESPGELAARILGRSSCRRSELDGLHRLYVSARYGAGDVGSEDRDEARRLLASLTGP